MPLPNDLDRLPLKLIKSVHLLSQDALTTKFWRKSIKRYHRNNIMDGGTNYMKTLPPASLNGGGGIKIKKVQRYVLPRSDIPRV